MIVAALYVDRNGGYYRMGGVDPWDRERDARRYRGPYPVVAHPPCEKWTNFACLNFMRHGGKRNRPGNDGGCFYAALSAIRQWGGVLEHPAGSHAWDTFHLPPPVGTGWSHVNGREWVCEVWQSAYGHKARKRTWLYYVGGQPPIELRWERNAGTHQIGFFDRVKPTLSKREASSTPDEFRIALVRLAMKSSGSKA